MKRENEHEGLFSNGLAAVLLFLMSESRNCHLLHTLRYLIDDLIRACHCPVSINVTLTVLGEGPLNPTQQAIANVVETDAAGNNVPVVAANLTFSIADSSVATVASNGDGTATVTAVAVGTTTLTVTDSVNSLTGSVGVSVTAAVDVPTTLTVTLGTPFFPTVAVTAAAVKSGAKPV